MESWYLLVASQVIGVVATTFGIVYLDQGLFGKSDNRSARRLFVALITAVLYAVVDQAQFALVPSPKHVYGLFGIVVQPDFGVPPAFHWIFGSVAEFFASLGLTSQWWTHLLKDRRVVWRLAASTIVLLAWYSYSRLVFNHYSVLEVALFDVGGVTSLALLVLHPRTLSQLSRRQLGIVGALLTVLGISVQCVALLLVLLK